MCTNETISWMLFGGAHAHVPPTPVNTPCVISKSCITTKGWYWAGKAAGHKEV